MIFFFSPSLSLSSSFPLLLLSWFHNEPLDLCPGGRVWDPTLNQLSSYITGAASWLALAGLFQKSFFFFFFYFFFLFFFFFFCCILDDVVWRDENTSHHCVTACSEKWVEQCHTHELWLNKTAGGGKSGLSRCKREWQIQCRRITIISFIKSSSRNQLLKRDESH